MPEPLPALPADTCSWAHSFALLKRHGFRPQRILDVGANHGAWTRAAIAYFPDASYTLVEPQDHLRAHVQDLRERGCALRWITAGVSDRPGRLPLTIAPNDVSSNFGLSPDEARRLGYTQVEVDLVTIDDLVARDGGAVPEMVKIDAEGFDLQALRGGRSLFGRTEVFYVEASVCATRVENTMAAVISMMTEAGYRMIDITDLNRSPRHGVLWLCELVFLREGSPLLAAASSY